MSKYIFFILLVFTISCKKENPTEATGGHDPNLFGLWILTSAKVNGEIIDSTQYGDLPVKIFLGADGSGKFTKQSGSSETITWYTTGSKLSIDDEIDINYTVLGNSITLSVKNDTTSTTVLTYDKEAEKEHDSKLFGLWTLTTTKENGEIIDSTQYGEEIPAKIFFGADGFGTLTDVNGSLETITWHTTGNQLLIDNEFEINYTVAEDILILTIMDGSERTESTYTKQ